MSWIRVIAAMPADVVSVRRAGGLVAGSPGVIAVRVHPESFACGAQQEDGDTRCR